MSLIVLCAGRYLIRIVPALLDAILTFNATSSISLNMLLDAVSVIIESILILDNPSLNSNVTNKQFFPSLTQLTIKFCINNDLPEPDPPANICSSPRLKPPYNFLSRTSQPVLI